MNATEVVVIDYGMGNLLSVQRGLEYCGATVRVTNDHRVILGAERVVLPGVGAFAQGMDELKKQGLDAVVLEVANRNVPLLGICLGMQMLLDESEEFGLTRGLGLISGRVIPVPVQDSAGRPQKIPHIGWNALILPKGRTGWDQTLMHDVKVGEDVYFVHSFMANPSNQNHRVADCVYGGVSVSAAVRRENIFGCQFHPEKSGAVGLKILKRFLM